jgi:hypothetical protein
MDEGRRIRRALKKVLKATPHACLVAPTRGRAIGFNFNSDRLAVAWDAGAWCLLYRIDELVGAELVVDGAVAARAYRGEPRRLLEDRGGPEEEVRLRFIFDDARYPDFDLALWLEEDRGRRKTLTAAEAVHEANSWISRTEALLRRPTAKPAPVAPRPPEPVAMLADEEDEDVAPWDEDGEDFEGDDEESEEKDFEESEEDEDFEDDEDDEEESEDEDAEEDEEEDEEEEEEEEEDDEEDDRAA